MKILTRSVPFYLLMVVSYKKISKEGLSSFLISFSFTFLLFERLRCYCNLFLQQNRRECQAHFVLWFLLPPIRKVKRKVTRFCPFTSGRQIVTVLSSLNSPSDTPHYFEHGSRPLSKAWTDWRQPFDGLR